MLKRTKYFIGGLFVALTLGAIAQTGGLPSRPRFLSVGVGTPAPSTNGNMNVAGSVTASNFVGNVGGVAPSDFARISQKNVFQSSGFAGAQTFVGTTDGRIWLKSTLAGVDEKYWGIAAESNGNLSIFTASDAESAVENAIVVSRSGAAVNSINLAKNVNVGGNVTASNFIGNVGGVAPSDFARLSQSNTFSANGPAFTISRSSAPNFRINESGVAADNKLWDVTAVSESLQMRALNDAGSSATAWLTVDRTGTTVDSINLQATNVQVNGSEVCRQNGTGCPSAGMTEVVDSSHVWTVQSCTTSPTITPVFIKHGSTVTVRIPNVQCTANAGVSVFQLTGTYPTGMTPNANAFQWSAVMQNNGTNVQGIFRMSTSNWQWIPLSGGTLSGTIGNQAASNSAHMSFTYTIN